MLNSCIINIIDSDLSLMKKKLRGYALLEAEELTLKEKRGQVAASFFASPISRRRWLRVKFYERSPLFIRPFVYFIYRYFIRLGFLDGREGLIFHYWQGLWYRLLVDYQVFKIITKRYCNIKLLN